jgi:hypothetical protein
MAIINIINTIAVLIITLLTILFPIGIISGVILAVVTSNQPDPAKKSKLKYWMLWSFLGPIVLLVVVLSIWGLINIATGAGSAPIH